MKDNMFVQVLVYLLVTWLVAQVGGTPEQQSIA